MAIGSWSRKVAGDETLGRKINNKTNNRRGGGGVQSHSYEPGTEQKMVIPLIEQDGHLAPVIFNVPVHKVRKDGALQFPKKSGGTFKGYEIRSMHPFSQGNSAIALELAERGEVCVIHELIELQNKKAWAAAREKFGEDLKGLDEDTRKELARFIKTQEEEFLFKPVYYPAFGEDDTAHTTMDTVILLLQYETESVSEVAPNGIERIVENVVKDENGQPKYTPALFNLSAERARKIAEAIDVGLDSGLVQYEDLHPYTDLPGTEAESQVNIGWVDLTFKWPSGSKMESGRNLAIFAIQSAKQSVTPELIESFQTGETGKKVLESAENMYFNRPSVKVRTRQEQLDALSAEALRTYNELSEEFAEELARDRENFQQHVFNRILTQNDKPVVEAATVETPEVADEPEVVEETEAVEPAKKEEAPKKEAKSSISDLLEKVTGK